MLKPTPKKKAAVNIPIKVVVKVIMKNKVKNKKISAEIVSHYLNGIKWNPDDAFCFLTFICFADFTAMPVVPVSYVRQLNSLFPQALIAVYRNSIVMIARRSDYQIRRTKERQQLEKFLTKNGMRYGVSMVFNNFMCLRHYYIQSSFAAAYCESHPDSRICYYENCQSDHVLQSLGTAADLRSFCHPGVLALWESGDEEQRELVRCLYRYVLNSSNLNTAAKALLIHRNTLVHRVEKLSRILDDDIKTPSPEQIFFYLLSCVIVMNGLL
jgi:hypothetical protein